MNTGNKLMNEIMLIMLVLSLCTTSLSKGQVVHNVATHLKVEPPKLKVGKTL